MWIIAVILFGLGFLGIIAGVLMGMGIGKHLDEKYGQRVKCWVGFCLYWGVAVPIIWTSGAPIFFTGLCLWLYVSIRFP